MKKLIFIVILSLVIANNMLPEQSIRKVPTTSFLEKKELNDSILYLALKYYKIKEPRIVLAQAKLESANYTSSVFKRTNNFLGLYNSRKKKYFEFNHWSECILAYKEMVEYKRKEGENYYQFLHRIGYAEDPQYISKVKRVVKQIEHY